ncbi:MAG: hypothetical protein EOO28_21070 [Comamonadaceae bacterium]|nr:MAG: hypothetical protein EOO28_21070 [Comamonadaceae bacterium]
MTLFGGASAKSIPAIGSADLLDDLVALARHEGTGTIVIARASEVPSNLPVTVDALRGATADGPASLWVQTSEDAAMTHRGYTEDEIANDLRLAVIGDAEGPQANVQTDFDDEFFSFVDSDLVKADSFTVVTGPRDTQAMKNDGDFRVVVMDINRAFPSSRPAAGDKRRVKGGHSDQAARLDVTSGKGRTMRPGDFERLAESGAAALIFSGVALDDDTTMRDAAVTYYVDRGFTVLSFDYMHNDADHHDELTMVVPASHRKRFDEFASLHDSQLTVWNTLQEPTPLDPAAEPPARVTPLVVIGTVAICMALGLAAAGAARRRTGTQPQVQAQRDPGSARRRGDKSSGRQASQGTTRSDTAQWAVVPGQKQGPPANQHLSSWLDGLTSSKEIFNSVCMIVENRTQGMDRPTVIDYLETQVLPDITLALAAMPDDGVSLGKAAASLAALLETVKIKGRLPGWLDKLDFDLAAFAQAVKLAQAVYPQNRELQISAGLLDDALARPGEDSDSDVPSSQGVSPSGSAADLAAAAALPERPAEMKMPRQVQVSTAHIYQEAYRLAQTRTEGGEPCGEIRGRDVYIPSFDHPLHIHVMRNKVVGKKNNGGHNDIVAQGGLLMSGHLQTFQDLAARDTEYDQTMRGFLDFVGEQGRDDQGR